jgi:hypothetical protein
VTVLKPPFETRETPSTVVNYSYYLAAKFQINAMRIA